VEDIYAISMTQAGQEVVESAESTSPRRRSKQTRELDMLLGDEGAVNMIYDAEHGQQTQKRVSENVTVAVEIHNGSCSRNTSYVVVKKKKIK
jgi:hypothetical protein